MLLNYWVQIGVALIIYGFIFFYYIWILRSQSLAILYPVYIGLSILLVVAIGVVFFDERLSMSQIFGCLAIIVGVIVMSQDFSEV